MGFWVNVIAAHLRPLVGEKSGGMLHKIAFWMLFRDLLRRKQYSALALHLIYQVLPSDRFGCFKWPLQGLSDLHLGDQKVTWKKLVLGGFKYCLFITPTWGNDPI